MQIKVELPDDIARRPDPGREALEALAIQGYRSGALTHYQASQLLGLSRLEFDRFLKDRNIYDHAYDADDLEQDLETLRQLEAKGLLGRP
jgi:predicted HTH domain antitoxin